MTSGKWVEHDGEIVFVDDHVHGPIKLRSRGVIDEVLCGSKCIGMIGSSVWMSEHMNRPGYYVNRDRAIDRIVEHHKRGGYTIPELRA